ncbi:hypothetical protein EVAR_68257_1 [Eumeta japonica]|uniref:Uncharacterized protein n=1 Tax=Eumeta variegata TaxID=151549 RepID=A0A4C1ZU44_EUMVA|nr:hypothetical protein EVAR_68257_1 [Eumeta japonica]
MHITTHGLVQKYQIYNKIPAPRSDRIGSLFKNQLSSEQKHERRLDATEKDVAPHRKTITGLAQFAEITLSSRIGLEISITQLLATRELLYKLAQGPAASTYLALQQ